MSDIMGKLSPILALIFFGFLLRRKRYFEPVAFNRIQDMVVNIAIPCMLFTSFVNMRFSNQYLLLSLSYTVYLILLLGAGFLIYHLFRLRYRFFPFLLTCFGFGTLGLPLYTILFGADNTQYMSVLGVGHELFVAVLFLPLIRAYFSGERYSVRRGLRALLSPSLVMVALALLIRGFGLNRLLTDNFLGVGVAGAIDKLGGLTLVLSLVMVGYRMRFSNLDNVRTSFAYAGIRILATLGLGTLYRILVINHFTRGEILFDHAYNILMIQHGSLALTALVGQYCSLEEQEVVNNVFVINVMASFVILVAYLAIWT